MKFNPDRRHFFDGLMNTGLVAVLGATFGPFIYKTAWDQLGEEKLQRDTEQIKGAIKERYGITVHVDFDPGSILSLERNDTRVDMQELSSPFLRFKAIEGLQRLLVLYPPDIFSNVKDIYIVDTIQTEGGLFQETIIDGLSFSGEEGGVAIEAQGVLREHYAVAGKVLPRRTVHHELAHKLMEDVTEEEWLAINPGAEYQIFWRMTEAEGKIPEGFATIYAIRTWKEDIASTAEMLFLAYDHLMDRSRNDPALKRKVDFVKESYERISGGRMNEQYWRDVTNNKVRESYWDTSR